MSQTKPSKPFFSIIIPTLNEEGYLPTLLEDLSKQTFTNFEVIHIDANSEDDTVKKAKSFSKKLSITSLISKKRNVSFQRNFGAKKANADWLIFMDADNKLPNYFLEGVKYQLSKNPEVSVFTTWAQIDYDSAMTNAIEQVINLSLEMYKRIKKPVAFGALLGCKRSVFDDVTFNERQKVFEDGLFVNEAVAAGHHFAVFREPRFVLSVRRIQQENTLKALQTIAAIQIKYLTGGDFSNYEGYPMEGGAIYKSEAKTPVLDREFLQVRDFGRYIATAPKKQLQAARSLLKKMKEFDVWES